MDEICRQIVPGEYPGWRRQDYDRRIQRCHIICILSTITFLGMTRTPIFTRSLREWPKVRLLRAGIWTILAAMPIAAAFLGHRWKGVRNRVWAQQRPQHNPPPVVRRTIDANPFIRPIQMREESLRERLVCQLLTQLRDQDEVVPSHLNGDLARSLLERAIEYETPLFRKAVQAFPGVRGVLDLQRIAEELTDEDITALMERSPHARWILGPDAWQVSPQQRAQLGDHLVAPPIEQPSGTEIILGDDHRECLARAAQDPSVRSIVFNEIEQPLALELFSMTRLSGFQTAGVMSAEELRALSTCKQLVKLDLWLTSPQDWGAVCELLGSLEDLRELSLIGEELSADQLQRVVTLCPRLEALRFNTAEADFGSVFERIGEAFPHLRELAIGGSRDPLTVADLTPLTERCPNLEQVHFLYPMVIPPPAMRYLIENLPRLQTLKSREQRADFDSIWVSFGGLLDLQLTSNYNRLLAVSHQISDAIRVRNLEFSVVPTTIEPICQALGKSPYLKNLILLVHIPLQHEQAQALSASISGGLSTFTLQGPKWDVPMLEALLANHPRIREVTLLTNQVGDLDRDALRACIDRYSAPPHNIRFLLPRGWL